MRICKFTNLEATMSAGPPDPTPPWRREMPDAATVRRIAGPLPWRLDDDGNLTIWKDGVWHPVGECIQCEELGPACFHCTKCKPPGHLYVGGGMTLDDFMVNPPKVAAMALLVHASLQDFPDPHAAHSHFLFLLVSFWTDAYPQHTGD